MNEVSLFTGYGGLTLGLRLAGVPQAVARLEELQLHMDKGNELAVAREAALREALQDLCDWQNGPPLPSYEEGWTAAHQKALALLASPSPAAERLLAEVEMRRKP